MTIDDDDSSKSSASSSEDILSHQAFSQPSPTKSNATDNSNNNEGDTKPQLETIHENGTTESSPNQNPAPSAAAPQVDEEAALRTVENVPIYTRLESPSNLYWREYTSKKSKLLVPVRIPPEPSEYIGFRASLIVKDADRQVVVQDLHSDKKSLYSVVPRSQLVPYHGNNDVEGEDNDDEDVTNSNNIEGNDSNNGNKEKDQWCPVRSQRYFKQLKRQFREIGDQQIRVEELYLEKVLKKAKEELASQSQLEKYDTPAIEDPKEEEDNEDKAAVHSLHELEVIDEEVNEESDQDTGPRRSKRKRSDFEDKNTDWLHVGDVIQFYKPSTEAGKKENLRRATIISIRPSQDHPLKLDCANDFTCFDVPNDHPICRIARNERGKLVDIENGKWWLVNTFALKHEGSNDAFAKVMERKIAEKKEALEMNKQRAIEGIKRDGCGPTDMLR